MTTAANPAEDLVNSEFPDVYRPLLEPALRRAYSAAEAVMEREEFLRIPSAAVQRGDLVMLASENEIFKLVRDGHLPFDASWDDHATPTGKHLVLRSPAALVTISQVESPRMRPRYASFRQTYAAPNTAYLFDDWNTEMERDGNRGHILLLHGHGSLRFCNLAVPHPREHRLIWQTPDLLALEHEAISSTEFRREGPSDSPDADIDDIAEEVLKALVDNRR